jgi:alpha-glucosidase
MIVIVDAGLSADDDNNKYFQDALTKNALIRSSIDVSEETFGGVLVSHVWPNKTVFLDFFSDDAADIWNQGLKDLYEKVPYDGLWLDMNEATSFCNGECANWTAPNSTNDTASQPVESNLTPTKRRLSEELSNKNPNLDTHRVNRIKPGHGPVSTKSAAKFMVVDDDEDQGFTNHTWYMSAKSQDDNSTYYLPFIPGRVNLDNMTMSLNATHPSNNMSEYDVHSLFGHLEAKRTR